MATIDSNYRNPDQTTQMGEEVSAWSNSTWRKYLGSIRIDRESCQWRLNTVWSRSIKGDSQLSLLNQAVACVDLTTLEGTDTTRRIERLVKRASSPDPEDLTMGPVAAVCVWGDRALTTKNALTKLNSNPHTNILKRQTNDMTSNFTGPKLAVVAGSFPSGREDLASKKIEVIKAVSNGAEEVDIVLDRADFLQGNYTKVYNELAALKVCSGQATLKVILENCELGDLDNIARASRLALWAGADFIKTSTGKGTGGAEPLAVLIMLEEVREWYNLTGQYRGVKAAGGIKEAKEALRYLCLVNDVAGSSWLSNKLWRFGASSLLDDLCAQRRHTIQGHYVGPKYFPMS